MMKVVFTERGLLNDSVRVALQACADLCEMDVDSELYQEIRDADVIWVGLRRTISRSLLSHATRLKVIVTPTTGHNHIDEPACAELGIRVLSLRGESEFLSQVSATAELTWGLLLALVRKIPSAYAHATSKPWNRDLFCGSELQGKTLGIVGYGRLGKIVGRYALAFQMKVLAHDREQSLGTSVVEKVTLPELLDRSDIVTIHIPLNEFTERLLGEKEFASMRPGALLINTARGEIVDEMALVNALESGHLGGAACDVVAGEYFSEPGWEKRHPLISYARKNTNLILTPHMGGLTVESVTKTSKFMAEKLFRYLKEYQSGN